jgi:monoterpene epsilon-lactone hydrolase
MHMGSPEFSALKSRFATTVAPGSGAGLSLAEQRAASEHFGDLATEPDGVDYSDGDADGVRVLFIRPADADQRHVIQYLHGGGYQKCSVESHRKMAGHIAKAAGAVAVSVDYRLTPEHRHPAPVEDSLTVYRWLPATGYGAAQIVLAGDSSGGGLALGTALALKAAATALPAAVVAVSPWTDMSISGESIVSRAATDVTTSVSYLRHLRDSFVSPNQWNDPTASPLSGDLSGLPPIYLMAGDDEILRDDAIRFGAKAITAGVDVTFDIVPEMQHIFIKAVGSMPESDLAVARLGAYLLRAFAADAVQLAGETRIWVAESELDRAVAVRGRVGHVLH